MDDSTIGCNTAGNRYDEEVARRLVDGGERDGKKAARNGDL
jgi:hypothetical protein